MINELRVRDLGVIADVELVLDEGMTAITGETGAGKTLIVDALELLVGGRSDPSMVRSGATETSVEGRFFNDGEEIVLERTIPAQGRSRSSINGTLAPLSALAELGQDLVDLYGQHAHQSLLHAVEQRHSLDRFAGIDLGPLRLRREEIAAVDRRLAELGGDEAMRIRELDLLRYELGEIEILDINTENEDELLAQEHEILQSAVALRESVSSAYEHIVGGQGDGARDLIGAATETLSHHDPLARHAQRLRALSAELDDLAVDLRQATESFEENPERLEEIRERRGAFSRIIKKHGESLADVLRAEAELRARIEVLESSSALRSQLLDERRRLEDELGREESLVGDQRRLSARPLAERVEEHLQHLGLEGARLLIELPDEGIADEVTFLLGANRGESALPLAKVASGGELARTMLALRLVLSAGPSTLIFDEVDAGIGGEAAIAVGRALRELGREHQVIVVTHLAQVAAFADNQLVVEKYELGDRTLSRVVPVEGEARISELARMLSGRPDSEVAKRHAAELLAEVTKIPSTSP